MKVVVQRQSSERRSVGNEE